jgi:hypothetical protein
VHRRRPPTPVGSGPGITPNVRPGRWRTNFLNVSEKGGGRRQEEGRRLERRVRKGVPFRECLASIPYPSLFKSRRLVYFPLSSLLLSRCRFKTFRRTHWTPSKARTDPNISLPSSPPPFYPPTYGIWVNALWFLSLVNSMACAILANLLQKWARKCLKATRPSSTASEQKRACSHAFYADGVEKFLFPWVFEL